MPYYDFECTECGHRFEAYRKATARSLPRCPECGGRARKVFHAVGIIFKGSGFHVTDYPSGDRKRGKGASSGAGSGKGKTPVESGAKDDKA